MIRLFQVDAFTRTPFTGNAAGVVLGGDALSSETMQAIARELNNSETAFLLEPRSDDHEVFVRYFTPLLEVPICGHATIAAHYVRSRLLDLPTSRVVQRSAAGLFPIDVIAGDDYRIVMTQLRPTFGPRLSPQWRLQLATALGVELSQLDEELPARTVSTGSPKLLVPMTSSEALDSIVPNLRSIETLTRQAGANGVFAFTLRPSTDGVLAEARMFAPALGIAEDPVTGNGNGPLGAYLATEGVLAGDGVHTFAALQGKAMGRPGIARVEVTVRDGNVEQVRVGDEAVIVFETTYAA
ncbi:MAG TPA: PhzF family phenazine biosynthesis isomerase [Thermoanaerobaculia bacterium]|nr:PhzF family phenazine biosynthesis isomerase [Thermoanaerobaculia bacterium]